MTSMVPHAKNEAGDVVEERLDFVVWIGVFEETCAKATGQETTETNASIRCKLL